MSANTIQTFSPSSTQSFPTSIVLDSLIPLSTTLESSIESSLGGPFSNSGLAIAENSEFTIRTPSAGLSGNGVPMSILTPTMTSVSPIFTLAEPSALSSNPVSIVVGLYSVCDLLSSLEVAIFSLKYCLF